MDESTLRALIEDIRSGTISPDNAVNELRRLPFADLGFAKVDHHRQLRQLLPEAIYGPGKTPQHCVAIATELLQHGEGPVILTRADNAQVAAVTNANQGATVTQITKDQAIVVWRPKVAEPGEHVHKVAILTAGTADLPVANECLATLEALGFKPRLHADCGVAGIHRLLATVDQLQDLDALVVVAGMEGALASVAGGITPAPVIAVPTSVGYGSAFEGITALLAMLSSCAAGVTVAGIDNGFGAACAVARILLNEPHQNEPHQND